MVDSNGGTCKQDSLQRRKSSVYIVDPSHAAVTQMLSVIMLIVLLWLALMFAGAFAVCAFAVGFRYTTVGQEEKREECVQTSLSECDEPEKDVSETNYKEVEDPGTEQGDTGDEIRNKLNLGSDCKENSEIYDRMAQECENT